MKNKIVLAILLGIVFLVVIGIKITNKSSEPIGVAQTVAPTAEPTPLPTEKPTAEPTPMPTEAPTPEPTVEPTPAPTAEPTPEAVEEEPVVEASPAPTATPNPNVTVKTEEEKRAETPIPSEADLWAELGFSEAPQAVEGTGLLGTSGNGTHFGDAQ